MACLSSPLLLCIYLNAFPCSVRASTGLPILFLKYTEWPAVFPTHFPFLKPLPRTLSSPSALPDFPQACQVVLAVPIWLPVLRALILTVYLIPFSWRLCSQTNVRTIYERCIHAPTCLKLLKFLKLFMYCVCAGGRERRNVNAPQHTEDKPLW